MTEFHIFWRVLKEDIDAYTWSSLPYFCFQVIHNEILAYDYFPNMIYASENGVVVVIYYMYTDFTTFI